MDSNAFTLDDTQMILDTALHVAAFKLPNIEVCRSRHPLYTSTFLVAIDSMLDSGELPFKGGYDGVRIAEYSRNKEVTDEYDDLFLDGLEESLERSLNRREYRCLDVWNRFLMNAVGLAVWVKDGKIEIK